MRLIAAILILFAVPCFAEYSMTIDALNGTDAFGDAGIKTNFEVITKAADVSWKIQYKVNDVWTDFEPKTGDDLWTIFAFIVDSRSYPSVHNLYTPSEVDSTRVLATTDSASDVTVRMW